MKLELPLTTILLLLANTSCGDSILAGKADTLVLTGSSTVAPLAAELGRRFEEQHPGFHVDVQSGGSSRGIADARAGHADIGMASRSLDASEDDLVATPIARDGVGLIVNAANPVDRLNADQVRAIFRGEFTDWSQLGSPPGPITVVNKAEGRATLEVFLTHFGLKNREIKAAVIAGENEQAIKTVAGTPGSIGYVSIGNAELDIDAGVSIKLLSLDGIEATSLNVASGEYGLARPLNLVTLGAPSGRSLEFIQFASSADNADIVREASYVPVSVP